MMRDLFNKDIPVKFLIFSGCLFLLMFTVENINGRFYLNDLKVYYSAAEALIHGNAVYNTAFGLGSGFYKYSPFSLFLFFPYLLIPFATAKVLHFVIIAFCATMTVWMLYRLYINYLFHRNATSPNGVMALAFLSVIRQITREMHLGNVNFIILALSVVTLYAVVEKKTIIAALGLAIIIITKPYLGIILLPLMYRKEFKLLLVFSALIALFLVLPVLARGIVGNYELHQAWVQTMLTHNVGYMSTQTFSYIFNYYLNIHQTTLVAAVILAAVIGSYTFYIYRTKSIDKKSLIFEWFILMAIVPNLFKTDTQQFIFVLPLILLIILYSSLQRNNMLIIVFTVTALIFGWNSSDIIGHYISDLLDEMGMIGICNVAFIGMALLIASKMKQFNQMPTDNNSL